MTTSSEQLSAQVSAQFSALRTSTWQAQLDLLQAFSSRAIESAEQLISLNLRASRTSVEQASGTFKQLLDATNPRDIIAVGSRAQGQWHYLFEYGRELLGIASGVQIGTWSTQASGHVLPAPLHLAHTANVPTTVSQVAEQVSIATADATTVTTEIAKAAADTGAALAEAGLHAATQAAQAAKPAADAAVHTAEKAAEQQADAVQQQVEAAIETAIADDAPQARAKPLAQALNEVAPKPASAGHPIASTLPLEAADHVELPIVTPSDATPPLHVPVPPPAAKERRTSRRK